MLEMATETPYLRRQLSQTGSIKRTGDGIFFIGQERRKGIGSGLPDATEKTRHIYNLAGEIFGANDAALTLSNMNNVTTLEVQSANAAANLSWLSIAKDKHEELDTPRVEFGESFGEIMALRRIFKSDRDFLTFIKKRGEIMRDAAKAHEDASGEKTGMISVKTRPSKTLGELEHKQKVLAEINTELTDPENNFGIYLATKTSRSRTAFGGTQGALDNALDYLRRYREVSAMDIKTGAAFHTPLYTGVKEPLIEYFKHLPFELQDPDVPIMSATHRNPIFITTWQNGIEEITRLPEEPVYCVEMLDVADKIMLLNRIYIIGDKPEMAEGLAENPTRYKSDPVISKRRTKVAGGVALLGAVGIAAWRITLSKNNQKRNDEKKN